jgi:hypothetical protein
VSFFLGVGRLDEVDVDVPDAKAVPFSLGEDERVSRKLSASGVENKAWDFLANFSAPEISPCVFLRRAISRDLFH